MYGALSLVLRHISKWIGYRPETEGRGIMIKSGLSGAFLYDNREKFSVEY